LDKTIGIDLVPTKPMTEEEFAKWTAIKEAERKEWERTHPEEVAARMKLEEKEKSKKPYILTADEEEIVKELLHTDSIEGLIVSIMNDGEISLRTGWQTWASLCGREWWINLQKKTCKLTAMS
jgi:hypothetical protein